MKNIFYIVILLIAISSCSDKSAVVIEEDFEVAIYETVNFTEGDFSILFNEVLEDSRCPINAICIWEGRAVVEVILTDNGSSKQTTVEMVTFNSIDNDSKLSVIYGNYEIELKEVSPYNSENNDPDDYSLVLRISE